jgi:UDP-N-acetylmuramate dehydrogenase
MIETRIRERFLSACWRIGMTNTMQWNIQYNVPLSPFTTFGIGGNAEAFLSVSSVELIDALNYLSLHGHYTLLIGSGSNVVIPDEGIPGMVVRIVGGEVVQHGNAFLVDAGTSLHHVVHASIQLGFSGLEYLTGIPGTVGGAVVGNAGAYGHSLSEVIEKVKIWDQGSVTWMDAKACAFSYRESIFKHREYVVIQVALKLHPSNKGQLVKISDEIHAARQNKYPSHLKCAGSFFKNVLVSSVSPKSLTRIPKEAIRGGKISAGYLLEQVGAIGMKEGEIAVSSFHGNVLVKNDQGTAKDLRALDRRLKELVQNRFGITLEEEVRVIVPQV